VKRRVCSIEKNPVISTLHQQEVAMLILSRKEGETILIDGGIKVHVRTIHGSRVQIGVEAPADVRILREELESTTHPSNQILPPDVRLASVA
jgi:carbon storage regulator